MKKDEEVKNLSGRKGNPDRIFEMVIQYKL